MRIAFVWDWPIVPEQAITWKDGLAAAIKILSQKYELKVFAMGPSEYTLPHEYFPIYVTRDINASVKEFNPDRIIIWGDTTRPAAEQLAPLGAPIALCFAGGHLDGGAVPFISHYFVESKVYAEKMGARGRSVSTAFGTNTELFKPIPAQHKLFDALFPATFALWKRHDLFAKATGGLTACAVGYKYLTHEKECWEICEKNGVLTLPHCSPETLTQLYSASRCVVIPSRADGGSQRTVLESMACGIRPIVCGDSDKTTEYVRESGFGITVEPEANKIREAINYCINNPNDGQKGIDYIKNN